MAKGKQKQVVSRFVIGGLLVIFLGAVLISCTSEKTEAGDEQIAYYTCEMHPDMKVNVEECKQGKTECPICNTDLKPVNKEKGSEEEQISHYTCSMHPSVKVSVEEYEKGSTQCPICNMDLIPIYKEKEPSQ